LSEAQPSHTSPRNWTQADVARLVDQERSQIAHDLHDDLLPLLFAARARAEVLASKLGVNGSGSDDQDAADSLTQIAVWLNDAMQWSRRLLGSIHTADFSIKTWEEVAQDQVSEICRDVELVWQLDRDTVHAANDLATVAFRVCVESIRNAVRHGKAKRITIASSQVDQWYRITILDDGIGFDPEKISGDHFGLQIMRSRAELVGGKLMVHSNPGNPTCVELRLPRRDNDVSQ
jgi:signal transduction histidine kinase